jgi:predicted ester cyclase
VAEHYAPGGTIAVNGGTPTEITEVARSFMSTFPDIELFMDDVVVKDDAIEFHWTFVGTNTGPGGTGKRVRISGFEEWTLGDDGLVAESLGHFDQAEYDRQIEHGTAESE